MRKRILLVEDDDHERQIYCRALRSKGYDVLEARDGEDALRVARSELPDLMLVDILLPSISGITLADLLKRSRITASIPIVGVTGVAPDRQELREVGFAGLLAKPVGPLQLVREVERFLNAGVADAEQDPDG
jgi:two-component system, cell cycle response regulator DivK